MDYHPLFGLRSTKKNSLIHTIWKILDKLDKFSLKFAKCVICLDEAMEELIKERAPNVKTFICPTFTLEKVERLNLAQKRNHVDSLSFLYSGNLGRAHDTEDLKRLLGLLSEKVHVVLSYCGNSESSIKRFRDKRMAGIVSQSKFLFSILASPVYKHLFYVKINAIFQGVYFG